jgi:hypothetical protein
MHAVCQYRGTGILTPSATPRRCAFNGGGRRSERQPPPECYLRALADQMEDEVELGTCRVPELEIH